MAHVRGRGVEVFDCANALRMLADRIDRGEYKAFDLSLDAGIEDVTPDGAGAVAVRLSGVEVLSLVMERV